MKRTLFYYASHFYYESNFDKIGILVLNNALNVLLSYNTRLYVNNSNYYLYCQN